MLTTRKILRCFYDAAVDAINHDGIEHAGYIAFLSILSIFPFLVFFFAIAGSIGQSEIGLKMADIILQNHLIPQNALTAIQPRIEEIISGPPQGLLTIAIVGAIWTASSGVEALRTILNRVYRVKTPPAYIWRRLLSIAQFIIITGMMIAIIFLLIIAPNIWAHIHDAISPNFWAEIDKIVGSVDDNQLFAKSWNYARYAITALVLFIAVLFSYKSIPNIKINLKATTPGAAVVVVLWFVSASLLSEYLQNFKQVHIIYGSLGGFIAALLFFYIAAMIYIYGAEFNFLLEKALGHKIKEKIHVG